MTRPRILIAVFVLTGLLLAGSSFAQQAPGKAEKPSELSVFKASTVIGRQVVNVQGESLGKIEDLVLDPEEGRIRYAALSYGSILGLGGKLFAVAWENLEIQPDGQAFVLDLPTEALQHAPSFDKSNWPQQPNPVWRASVWRDEVVSGRIQEVNPDDATFSLTTETGNTVELQAPAELLVDLQAGDAVEVKIAGKQATKIHKKEGSPQPNTDDTQHTPQKPSDTRSRQPSTN